MVTGQSNKTQLNRQNWTNLFEQIVNLPKTICPKYWLAQKSIEQNTNWTDCNSPNVDYTNFFIEQIWTDQKAWGDGTCPNGISPTVLSPNRTCPNGICPNRFCPNGNCPNSWVVKQELALTESALTESALTVRVAKQESALTGICPNRISPNSLSYETGISPNRNLP